MGFGTWNNLEPGKQLVKSKTNIAFNVIRDQHIQNIVLK